MSIAQELGAKYTRAREVDGIVYLEELEDRGAALSREWSIKALSRNEKDALIASKANEARKALGRRDHRGR